MPGRAFVLFVVLLASAGCGSSGAKVSGKVTCGTRAVPGSILFSPLGQGPNNTVEAVPATLGPDGSYTLELKTTGKHRVVISPSDIIYPAKPGQEYPCDLSPLEYDVKPGDNEIIIELRPRGK